MKFGEAFEIFQNELWKEYGPGMDVTKLGLSPELFSRVVMDMRRVNRYSAYERIDISIKDLGEFKFRGVPILAREKDNF